MFSNIYLHVIIDATLLIIYLLYMNAVYLIIISGNCCVVWYSYYMETITYQIVLEDILPNIYKL